MQQLLLPQPLESQGQRDETEIGMKWTVKREAAFHSPANE